MKKNCTNSKVLDSNNESSKEIVSNNGSNDFKNHILFKKIFSKFFTKEIILYAIFGILTTIINIGSFYIMITFFNISDNLANNIAITIAVLIAYITNKDLVFHSKAQGFSENFIEFCKFILGRLFTMFVESIGGSLLFKYVPIPAIFSKCFITVIVIILNFFISKFFTFKSTNKV